jgi:hypothetical protein
MATKRSVGWARALTAATAVSASLSAIPLAACGGGDAVPAVPAGAPAAIPAALQARVRLEGCVLDQHGVPRTGTPVRALAADGRLIGDTVSDGGGVFRLAVPARSSVTLRVEGPDGEALVVPTGSTDLSVAACLWHRRA